MTSIGDCGVNCPACGEHIRLTGSVTLLKRQPDTRYVEAKIHCDDAPLRAHLTAAHPDLTTV